MATSADLNNTASGMIRGAVMDLKEMQGAYREVLMMYDSLFPSHPERKPQNEDIADPFEKDGENPD